MKKQFIQLFTCLLIMTIQTGIYAQPKTVNPFGLVYGGAIKENVPGKVNIHPVSYKLNGLTIAANVYTPAGFDTTKKYPESSLNKTCGNYPVLPILKKTTI